MLENFDQSIFLAATAERYTVDQVLKFLHDDFGDSEGEDSDFEGEGIYSYLSEVSNASELNSTSSPGPASGEEGLADTDDDWQPSLQDSDTILGKNLPV